MMSWLAYLAGPFAGVGLALRRGARRHLRKAYARAAAMTFSPASAIIDALGLRRAGS